MPYSRKETPFISVSKKYAVAKLMTILVASVPLATVVSTASLLSGCGFHLRGYDAPVRFDVAKTAIVIDDDRTSFPLKLPLSRRLEALGIDVVDSMSMIESTANSTMTNSTAEPIATIKVDNLRFKRYELVGVLTEIRLVLSADVTYNTYKNGQPVTLTNPIQVERSYQYNEASVSTDDQQGGQIRDWLYDSLARRITDQYVAIGLPKIAPSAVESASKTIKNVTNVAPIPRTEGSTVVVTPNP